MKKNFVLSIIFIIILIINLCIVSKADNDSTQKENTNVKLGVMYNTHIQNIGWETNLSKKDGDTSGTTGRGLRLEGIHIKLYGTESSNLKVKYQVHVQNIGWQNWNENGAMAGTTGRSLRLEAIKIRLESSDDYSIQYRVHVQNIGWQDWKTDGDIAGTTGKGLRLEAIEIKIVPKVKKVSMYIDTPSNNSVFYTPSKIQVYGWKMANIKGTKIRAYMDNTEITNVSYNSRNDVIKVIEGYGTEIENKTPGFSFSINTSDTTKIKDGIHTIKVDVCTSDNKVLKETIIKVNIDRKLHVQYQAHIQNIGWQGYVIDGQQAGTTGKSLRIEALNLNLINAPSNVKIKYQAHIQNIGWQNWNENGAMAGTTGKSLRMEAIRIKLENADNYSIQYRTHVQNIGWQEWCYDGEMAGTVGIGRQIEAIQIKIVPKIIQNKTKIYLDEPTNIITTKNNKIRGWVMTTCTNTTIKMFIDAKELNTQNLKRTERQDILNNEKGYGAKNTNPGFELTVDFSKYNIGNHSLKVEILNNNDVLAEYVKNFKIEKIVEHSIGTYGKTGLKVAGDSRGQDLKYYKWGSGPNVLFATFALHGYEDIWPRDGYELIEIANNFYNQLINENDNSLGNKWTIYIFPGINLDGLSYGYTNNGPGRTTLYSAAPHHKGIDMNRCWSVGFKAMRTNRNYTGNEPFYAYEARYLRDFLISHRATNGQTLLVDLHGWTQQLIGDPTMSAYYRNQFPENDTSAVGRYGPGYLVNWARSSLGANGRAAKAALVELPNRGVNGHQSALNNRFSQRYIDATLSMLKGM